MNKSSPNEERASQDVKTRYESIQMSPKIKRKKKRDGSEIYKAPQAAGLRNGFPHRRTHLVYNGRRPRPQKAAPPSSSSSTGPSTDHHPSSAAAAAASSTVPAAQRPAPDPDPAAEGPPLSAVATSLRRARSMSENARVRRIVRAKGLGALDLGGRPQPRRGPARLGVAAGRQEKPESGTLSPGGGQEQRGGGEGGSAVGREGGTTALATEDEDEDEDEDFDHFDDCDDAEDGDSSSSSEQDAHSTHASRPLDRTVATFLRSSSPSRYVPGPIRTLRTFGLYAVPAMTALDVLRSGDMAAGRANALALAAAATTDEEVLEELVGHFAGYGFGSGPATDGESLDRYWAVPPRPASASSSSRGRAGVRGRGAPPPLALPHHAASAVVAGECSVGMPSPRSGTGSAGEKRWSSGVSSGLSGVSGASGATAGTGVSGLSGTGSAPMGDGSRNVSLESQHEGGDSLSVAAKLDATNASTQAKGASAAGTDGSETSKTRGIRAKARGNLADSPSGGRSSLPSHWLPRASRKSRITGVRGGGPAPEDEDTDSNTMANDDASANATTKSKDCSASPTSRGKQECQGAPGKLRRLLLGGRL